MVKWPLRKGQYQRGYLKLRSRSVLAERASPTKEGRTERVQGRRARYIKAGSLKWETEVTDKEPEPTSNLAGHRDPCPQTSSRTTPGTVPHPGGSLLSTRSDPLTMRKESTMLSDPWASAGRGVVRSGRPATGVAWVRGRYI